MSDARTFTAEVEYLARQLRALSADDRARYFAGGVEGAARIAARHVKRAGLRDTSPLTRRIITAGAVEASAARNAGTGILYATASIGGRDPVRASGKPYAGQVVFGSEFGGQRRTYARTDPAAKAVKLRRRRGVSVAEQAALYRAAGMSTRQTTLQFRPWNRDGYWLFPALRDADADIVRAYTAPLDDLVQKVTR